MALRQISHHLRDQLEADEKAVKRVVVQLVGAAKQIVE